MREDALARTSKVSHDKKRKVEHQVKDDDEQHDVGNKRQRELVSVNGSLERSSGCPQEGAYHSFEPHNISRSDLFSLSVQMLLSKFM